jgi:hypothetical protein
MQMKLMKFLKSRKNMKRTDEIIQELLNMVSKSEHPLMDNSHILDTRKARKLLLELKEKLKNE